MRATTIAIAAVIALALVALPALPAAEDVSPVGSADARPPCVIGQNGCIIPMYCVMEPCPSYP
jgi:hypothetical protein